MTAPVELDAVARNWLSALKVAKDQIAQLEEVALRCRQQLEAVLGDAELATVDGEPAIRYTVVTSNRLDQKKLKEQRPDVYAEFTRPQGSRRFTICEDGK